MPVFPTAKMAVPRRLNCQTNMRMRIPEPFTPSAVLPGATLYAMRRDPLAFFTRLAREQGDIARFRFGDHENDLYLFNHPDYIREVLVTQDRNFTKWFSVDRIKEVLEQLGELPGNWWSRLSIIRERLQRSGFSAHPLSR